MRSSTSRGTGAFVGRDEHLERLISAWRGVREGLSGPRVVSVVGEPGLGKTRLAQEFYRWLVITEQDSGQDQSGYWPEDLAVDDNSLQVNPAEGSWNSAASVPFLWWGIRLSDPGEWNRVSTGALPAHVEQFLVPHLEPFHREQRQRQRLVQVAKVGGAVAADAVIDLIPFLGLVKKVGEVGLELKGIHDEWRKDARVEDAAAMADRRRASLVEQVVGDLEKLFSGPAGRRVPAVILLDDAQFSSDDPSVTALVEALLPAMTEGRWPLLLLVTHWEREWVADELSPIATLLKRHARHELEGVTELKLGPLADLGSLLATGLPGLTAEQHDALLERAGGNPRYLAEIVRFATGPVGRSLFEGRDTSAAMTPAGLSRLLAKSVKLNDVILERLAGVPDVVQQAVVLAGLQGQEFSEWLLRAVAVKLDAAELGASTATVSSAVDDAASPHALVARLSRQRAAFSQRIYHDVARELLPAWYDETEASTALREVVRGVLDGELIPDYGDDDAPANFDDLYSMAVALFAGSEDPAELRYAAHSLHLLLVAAVDESDLHGAHALAVRQAGLLERLEDGFLDGDLDWLRQANRALAAYGDHEAQRPLLVRLIELSGATYDDDANEWSTAMYIEVLLDLAEFHRARGWRQGREDALAQSLAVLVSSEQLQDAPVQGEPVQGESGQGGPLLLRASLRLHRLHVAWYRENGRIADAQTLAQHAATMAQRLGELEPGPANRFQAAASLAQVGRGAIALGDTLAASAALEGSTATLRELLSEFHATGLEIQLAENLDALAEVRAVQGDQHSAKRLLDESLSLMRKHFEVAPSAVQACANLADSLERVAAADAERSELDSAWVHGSEAVELRRAVLARVNGTAATADLGYSLVSLGRVAYRRGDHGLGLDLFDEGLALLRRSFATTGGVSERWQLLNAIRLAVPAVMARSGLAAALALLDESTGLIEGIPEDANDVFSASVTSLDSLRTEVLELSGRN